MQLGTLEHCLQECPATATKWLQILGEADPSLSILERWSCSCVETLLWHGLSSHQQQIDNKEVHNRKDAVSSAQIRTSHCHCKLRTYQHLMDSTTDPARQKCSELRIRWNTGWWTVQHYHKPDWKSLDIIISTLTFSLHLCRRSSRWQGVHSSTESVLVHMPSSSTTKTITHYSTSICTCSLKVGFHYPSSRAEFTGRVDGPRTRVHFLTPVNSGRELG